MHRRHGLRSGLAFDPDVERKAFSETKYPRGNLDFRFNLGFADGHAIPPGWKPRLYVSQDGRRYHFQTGSKGGFHLVGAGVIMQLKQNNKSMSDIIMKFWRAA